MTTIGTTSSSSIDPTTMAAQLVAAERAPTDTRYAATETKIKSQVSAVATLRSAFSALNSAITTLTSKTTTSARLATVGTGAGFTATAAAGAATGSYSVEVRALATAQKLSSAGYASRDTTVGTGTLGISFGSTNLSVDINSSNNSLVGIRDAINAAAGGKGVTASIVTGDDGAHLVLTSLDGGTSNAITITASNDNGSLAGLTYSAGTTSGMTQLVAASDSEVVVDGVVRTSSSNTITNLVDGVTFNLTNASPGTTVQMTITNDAASQVTAVQAFVDKYNAALAAIATATSYDSTTQTAAALNGDSMVRGTTRQLRDLVGSSVVDLKALGITIAKDGKLTLSQSDFTAAMTADSSTLAKVFGSGTDTMVGKVSTVLKGLTDSGGLLDSRSDTLTAQTKKLDAQKDALDVRMAAAEARYKAQFTALDTLMTQLQSTSDFLTQQLAKSSSDD
ncbi:flagellar hook-associated protein 2 [Pseudoxanthomonas sp. GM95]|uniref:flagellar filament capping protein FliD n=1 Tax=Pseudoxanthomonas sp. GM95 TaxID=1881043 RepID=UPI0008B16A16|nr:flagellar filament capping protein FliD [Pseudoxanthomonas sp. GM95]SEK51140.1 flagellar hook-associated protein 2 [Pseudoxanthomonas sp. GM95]